MAGRTSSAMLAALLGLAGCSEVPDPCLVVTAPADRFAATLQVVDEEGAPIVGARVSAAGLEAVSDATGRVTLAELADAVVAEVAADGYLAEPVPLGWADDGREHVIRLWASEGGRRIAVHSAGDVMFGRRYEEPPEGEPLIPRATAAAGAEAVVAAVRPIFALADLSTVNLETVVSDRDADAAYPGKRFILRSRPETLAGLASLGVDVASIANNHSRDYLDVGITDTRAALIAAGLPVVGASDGSTAAELPWTGMVGTQDVAIAAYTTVDGTFVNDSYPHDDVEPPADLAPTEAWQYAARAWGFSGDAVTVDQADRRIGGAWGAFSTLEPEAGEPDRDAMWSSMVEVYPEMQDWVARRGHGGAAAWDFTRTPLQLAELAAAHDLLIVQVHAGFQFQDASSDNVRGLARDAIDAGADLVICHHPHVLQGFEWYKGRLIAYSLGNFIFDQDFLSTFASVVLRTVWDGDTLLEARLVPIELDAYRPVPATGAAASRILGTVWERGLLRAQSVRDLEGGERAFPIELDVDTTEVHLVYEHNTGRLVAEPPTREAVTIELPPGQVVGFGGDAMVVPVPTAGPANLEVGRDLFGWGSFEDELADGEPDGAVHWALDSCQEAVAWGDAASGRGALRLRRDLGDPVFTRPVARVPLPQHRLWQDPEAPTPLDPPPSYSIHLRARRDGDARSKVRITIYNFDDSNPTEDPSSAELAEIELPFEVPGDGAWHEVDLVVPAAELEGHALPANMALFYVQLDPPDRNALATLDVDDLAFIEWRKAAELPALPGAWHFARQAGEASASATFELLPPVAP